MLVQQQPSVVQPTMTPQEPWSSGLCACFDDCGICLYGWCCPCFLVGESAERLRPGESQYWSACCTYCGLVSVIGCDVFVGYNQRQQIRGLFRLRDESCGCGDCCISCCCSGLVICQHARELKHRNYTAPPRVVWQQPGSVMVQPQLTVPMGQPMAVGQGVVMQPKMAGVAQAQVVPAQMAQPMQMAQPLQAQVVQAQIVK